jgi:hypothetical protein
MSKRLASALAAYGVLAVIAFRVLHGTALYAILCVFGIFAIKTLIAARVDR